MLRRYQKSPNDKNQAGISPINRDLRNTRVACPVEDGGLAATFQSRQMGTTYPLPYQVWL